MIIIMIIIIILLLKINAVKKSNKSTKC